MQRAIFHLSEFPSTDDIVRGGRRLEGGDAFFRRLTAAWKVLRKEALKFETRQSYEEPTNVSWKLWGNGDLKGSIEVLPAVRAADVPLYQMLAERNVRFIRLRPVQFPLTDYLKWEIECYHFNSRHGEQIYFVDHTAARRLFDSYARHDFVLFDECLALVHDYDEAGLIRGGWEITRPEAVRCLRNLYWTIVDLAEPYLQFLNR